jgi:hypothetical protein
MNFLKPLLLVLCTLASQVHAQTTLELTKVVGGLNKPLAMVQPNGDPRLFIVEQEGLIKVLENGVITDVFLDLSSKSILSLQSTIPGVLPHSHSVYLRCLFPIS